MADCPPPQTSTKEPLIKLGGEKEDVKEKIKYSETGNTYKNDEQSCTLTCSTTSDNVYFHRKKCGKKNEIVMQGKKTKMKVLITAFDHCSPRTKVCYSLL